MTEWSNLIFSNSYISLAMLNHLCYIFIRQKLIDLLVVWIGYFIPLFLRLVLNTVLDETIFQRLKIGDSLTVYLTVTTLIAIVTFSRNIYPLLTP